MVSRYHEGKGRPDRHSATVGVILLIQTPIISGVMGAISGMISAWVYNATFAWTGGVHFDLDDGEMAGE